MARNKNSGKKGPSTGITQQREPHERNPFRASWCQGNAGPHFKVTRRKKIRDSFWNFNAHAEQKGIWVQMKRKLYGDPETSTVVVAANGEVETNQGAQSVCSRSWSLRDCEITRGYACSSIDWKTLRRTRIFIEWVSGQEPPLTKKRRKFMCKTDNFVPLVVPGVSSSTGTCSSSTSSLQDPSSTTDTERSDEHAPGNWSQKYKKKRNGSRDSDDRCAEDLPEWLEEFTNNLEDIGNASASTRFSGLTYRTSKECGIKVKEAPSFFSLLQRPKLRSMLPNWNYRGLFAEDSLAKQYLEQRSLVSY